MKISLPVLTLALAMATAEARCSAGERCISVLPPPFTRGGASGFDLVMNEILAGSSSTYDLATKLLQQEFSGGDGRAPPSSGGSPNYAVTRDNDTGVSTLRMELPGVSPADVQVELENDSLLRVKGTRTLLTAKTDEVVEFDETFQLDEGVDPASIKVTLQHGLLEVTAERKSTTTKLLEIQVPVGGTDIKSMPLETVKEKEEAAGAAAVDVSAGSSVAAPVPDGEKQLRGPY